MDFTTSDIDYILSPQAIRDRTRQLFELATKGGTHFRLRLENLEQTADYVLKVIKDNYPDFKIPFHSRHGHINCGGVNRIAQLESALQGSNQDEITRSKLDLIVVSVLLDAGAGESWKFKERSIQVARSEGLAVASFHMFMSKDFSHDESLRATAQGLRGISTARLAEGFQVTQSNPLLGLEGRVHLLNELGRMMESNPSVFPQQRMGDVFDHLVGEYGERIPARVVLDFVLRYLGDIWPSRIRLGRQSLGDVWHHSALGNQQSTRSLVPFHKLSQWLTYSLLVPLIEHGLEVTGVDELTGLAEYRNGGLMIDAELIELKDKSLLGKAHEPSSELVIEWRALTVVLLDLLADEIRKKLGKSKEELPLARVLEGGTWHAGRRLAKEKRSSGAPPLNIVSDGTVF